MSHKIVLCLLPIFAFMSSVTHACEPAQRAKRLAIAILEDGQARLQRSHERGVPARLILSLKTARIRVPSAGKDFKACLQEKERMAFSEIATGEIFLCAKLLDRKEFSDEAIAQALIHEASHLTGEREECPATQEEVFAMMAGAGHLAYHPRDLHRCGLILSDSESQ